MLNVKKVSIKLYCFKEMSLVCSVIFIHHAFNANILDKDYAFSDGEILTVDNVVRHILNLMSGILSKSDLMKIPLKNIYNALYIQTVTRSFLKFLRASNVPTGLLNEMIAYLNGECNHHNFSELLLFSCLSIFAACKGFITLLTNGVLSVSGKVKKYCQHEAGAPMEAERYL